MCVSVRVCQSRRWRHQRPRGPPLHIYRPISNSTDHHFKRWKIVMINSASNIVDYNFVSIIFWGCWFGQMWEAVTWRAEPISAAGFSGSVLRHGLQAAPQSGAVGPGWNWRFIEDDVDLGQWGAATWRAEPISTELSLQLTLYGVKCAIDAPVYNIDRMASRRAVSQLIHVIGWWLRFETGFEFAMSAGLIPRPPNQIYIFFKRSYRIEEWC